MPDLICYIPNHTYSDDELLYISWLDANYYVSDKDGDSFKLATESGGATLVQFISTVTSGFVREITDSSVTTITGLDHLEGETVKVTSNGSVVATETVSNGQITVATGVFTYAVGLPYTLKVRTMRLGIPQEGNTVQSRIKRISETVTRFTRTLGGKAGQEYSGIEYLNDINSTYSTESQDTPQNFRATSGGFSEDAYTTVTSEDPLPMTVLSTITTVEIEEKR